MASIMEFFARSDGANSKIKFQLEEPIRFHTDFAQTMVN